jgi:hypothetical protein
VPLAASAVSLGQVFADEGLEVISASILAVSVKAHVMAVPLIRSDMFLLMLTPINSALFNRLITWGNSRGNKSASALLDELKHNRSQMFAAIRLASSSVSTPAMAESFVSRA